MDLIEVDQQVRLLALGFENLQDEYQKLFAQHQALERKLATAREQYNELANSYGSAALSTPPLSLSSASGKQKPDLSLSAADILESRPESLSKDAGESIRVAVKAADALRRGLPTLTNATADGVRIWSGRSADRLEAASSMMPSISESPLEQDFTVEGVPSNLGCPFASMTKKKLSSHAASVLSRYNQGSTGAAAGTSLSSVNRVNGKESLARKGDRRASFADPIKAEICGISDHDAESPYSERALNDHLDKQENTADGGVCPIRFLDQHSPEEVATYFENHKHELPRSHEVCVKRYQSNEKQIRELDAKYGNLVSMIQGLGAKHKDFLPEEPEEGDAVVEGGDVKDDEKVRKWATSVSAQAADITHDGEAEGRQSHFERPLRDIRLGESPSRPWGIQVPAKYLEKEGSETSSKPAYVNSSAVRQPNDEPSVKTRAEKPAQCPFGFDKAKPSEQLEKDRERTDEHEKSRPAFVATKNDMEPTRLGEASQKHSQMTFTGPVFIGYSVEDTARILRDSGLGTK